MATCQNCGREFPDDPQYALEDGLIDEYVRHSQDGEEPFVVSESDYYCDPECFIEALGGDDGA